MKPILRMTTIAMIAVFMFGGCGHRPADDDLETHDHEDHETTAHEAADHDDLETHDHEDHETTAHETAAHDDHDASSNEDHQANAHSDHEEHEVDSHDDHEINASKYGETYDDGVEDIIKIDPQVLREFGITFAIAKGGILRSTTSLAGEIVINPDQVAHVVSRADGIGSVIFHTIGDHVEAGETLAVIESPGLAESKAEFLSKAAHAALAATDLARAETIYSNTIRLLEVIANDPDVVTLRDEISGLDIGARRGNLITTYAELRAAEAVYEREKTLYGRQITSEYEFLSAESELKKAMAVFQAVRDDLAFANRRELDTARRGSIVTDVSLQAAKTRLFSFGLDEEEVQKVEHELPSQLARYEIHAPISGVIIDRHLVRGESVEAGEQIFVVVDLSSVWGYLTLYQRDLANIRQGQVAKVYTIHTSIGTETIIDYVSLIIDKATRTTTARIVLNNKNGDWRPGMFIRAEVLTSQHEVAVIVPRSALQTIDDVTVIFVETSEGIEHREVRLGESDTDSFEIITGLKIGERYVVSGGLALKAELNKAALEHAGHAH